MGQKMKEFKVFSKKYGWCLIFCIVFPTRHFPGTLGTCNLILDKGCGLLDEITRRFWMKVVDEVFQIVDGVYSH